MKQSIIKFASVPSFRKIAVGFAGVSALVAASASFAVDVAGPAVVAVEAAQAQGETVGGAVVAVVAALCVVGLIIAIIRKV